MATSPGGTEVGRVFVRVLPDTSEFALKLKTAIKSMGDNVEVGINLDTAAARAQIKALTSKAEMTLSVNADTSFAEAQVEKLAEDKQITVQARALTAKAAAELEALTDRRRNAVIRVQAVAQQAAAQLNALDRDRTAVIEALINDASIAKAEARIQALTRKQEIALNLNTSQISAKYNQLKAQMQRITTQLTVETDPAALARLQWQLEQVAEDTKLYADIHLRGQTQFVAQLEALKKRYQVVIDARTKRAEAAVAKLESQMAAIQDQRRVTIDAIFEGTKAKGEFERWRKSIREQEVRVVAALHTARATMDLESFKRLVETYRVELDADLNTARAATDSARLKALIERERVRINATLDTSKVAGQIAILSRDYAVELQARVDDAAARINLTTLAQDRDAYFNAILRTKKAMIQFTALEKDRIAELHVEVSNALEAQAELTRLGRSRSVDFNLEVNRLRKAEAELAWLTRDRTINVDVKTDFKTKLFDRFNRQLTGANRNARGLRGAIGSLGTAVSGMGRLFGGSILQVIGGFTKDLFGMAKGMQEIGGAMVGSVVNSMGVFVGAVLKSVAVIALLLAAGGALIAVFAGLAATILSVVAALLGMVLVLVMLAAALIGGLVGVAALAAMPALLIGGAIAFRTENKKLMKSVTQLGNSFKSVMKDAFRPMADELTREIPKLEKWLVSMKGTFKGVFSAASKHVEAFRVGIQRFVGGLLPGITRGLNAKPFQNFTNAVSKAMGDLGGALGKSFEILALNGDKFAVVISEIARGIGEVLPALAEFLAATATGAKATGQIADGVAGLFNELAESFNKALSTDGWESAVEGVSDMLTMFGDAIGEGFEEAMKYGDEFGRAFKEVGKFFQGISKPLAEFTGSAAKQFADVMPSVTKGFEEVIPAMQSFTEAFAVFAPDVVEAISDAVRDLFEYLSRPDVAEKCAEITKALIEFARTALGPDTLNAMLDMAIVVTDLMNIIAPFIPMLIQLFMVALGFKAAGALAAAFGGRLLTVGTALSGASGKAGKFGTALASMGTKLKGLGTVLKGGITSTFTTLGKQAAKLGPKFSSVGSSFGKAATSMGKNGGKMIGTLGKVLKSTMAWALRMAAQWFIALGPIGWIALLVAGIVALVIFYWDEIAAAAAIAWQYIYDTFWPIIDLIVLLVEGAVFLIGSIFMTLWTIVQMAWELVWAVIQSALAIIVGLVQIAIDTIVAAFWLLVDILKAAWDFIVGIVRGAIDLVVGIFKMLVGAITGDWQMIKDGAKQAFDGIIGIGKAFLQFFIDIGKSIGKFFLSVWDSIRDAASTAWNWISSAFSNAMGKIKDLALGAVEWVIQQFRNLKNKAGELLSKLNPANWFSASIDSEWNVTMNVKDFSPPKSPMLAGTFAAESVLLSDAKPFSSDTEGASNARATSKALNSLVSTPVSPGGTTTASNAGASVVVNAQTNASPYQIAKEIAWNLRRK